MKLSPIEIKQQQFEKSLRGYDTSEVQAFLNLMANEWEHLAARNRTLEKRVETMQKKIKHYERVEEALHETLQAAKKTAETKLEGARTEADHAIEKAEMQADKIVQGARQEQHRVQQSIMRLLDRRKEIIGGIQSYLDVARASVDQFAKDDNTIFLAPETPSARQRKSSVPQDQQSSSQIDASLPDRNRPAAATYPPGAENIDALVDALD